MNITPEKTRLTDKWLKASVLGCLWASSEIVLGSFFHNLRIPFASNLLTAFGIILLISVSHFWKEKGLFWRSGMVCALMKSISPSAVIFGPMIAIFMESLLMELPVRLFRRNIFSYLLAGMLAMSWNLFHMIASYIISYGWNIVDLYVFLARFTEKQFHIHFHNLWDPVLALWSFYLTCGLLAAIIGICIGRKTLKQPSGPQSISYKRVTDIKKKPADSNFHYSITWLIANLLAIAGVLFLMNNAGWVWWGGAGLAVIAIWAYRYRNSLRRLKKPGFWIAFVVITLLTSFLYTELQSSQEALSHGIFTGLEMNLRAAVMILGFSAIGKELVNPRIRAALVRTSFRQLPLALEVAFDTLPFVIASLPRPQDLFRRPFAILHQLAGQAAFWLDRVSLGLQKNDHVLLVTGKVDEGKSRLLAAAVEALKAGQIKVGGILCPKVMEGGRHVGYDLTEAATGKFEAFIRTDHDGEKIAAIGRYKVLKAGFEFGKQALSVEINIENQVVVVDEIGPWELENQGWAESVSQLLALTKIPMIWVVRTSLLEQVIRNWSLVGPLVVRADEDAEKSVCSILERIGSLIKQKES